MFRSPAIPAFTGLGLVAGVLSMGSFCAPRGATCVHYETTPCGVGLECNGCDDGRWLCMSPDDDEESVCSGSTGSSSDGTDYGVEGTYTWDFTCPQDSNAPGLNSDLEIPYGPCESEYKAYGVAAGCITGDIYETCLDLESCTGDPWGCAQWAEF